MSRMEQKTDPNIQYWDAFDSCPGCIGPVTGDAWSWWIITAQRLSHESGRSWFEGTFRLLLLLLLRKFMCHFPTKHVQNSLQRKHKGGGGIGHAFRHLSL